MFPGLASELQTAFREVSPFGSIVMDAEVVQDFPPFHDWLQTRIPKGWTADAPHLRLIAQHLDRLILGEQDRLLTSMPPRHAKSETITVRGGLYVLEHLPGQNILITAHTDRLARRFSRKLRTLAIEYGIPLNDEKTATDEWETAAGAVVMARGVGSPPTGVGFHWIFGDDPVKNREQADSQTYREKAWDWWAEDILQRLEPGGRIALTMTRWHHDDVAGRQQASDEPYPELVLRAVAEDGDPLGRKAGEALWPERYDVAALARIRRNMARTDGERGWEALFQQNPTPREGAMFKVANFGFCEMHEVPVGLNMITAIDLAASDGKGAFTAMVTMAGPDKNGKFYILEVVRGQWSSGERDKLMVVQAAKYGASVPIRLPQDPGQAGKQQVEWFYRMFAGYALIIKTETGDKATRAEPYATQVEAGNVILVRGAWNTDYVEEHRQFPMGKFKDQVDASANGFSELAVGDLVWA